MVLANLILASFTIASALLVILSRNAIYAAFFLLLTLLGVAGHYALLSAHFLAVIQILVYAGAVVVLIVFVLMMLGFGRGGFQGIEAPMPVVLLGGGMLATLLTAGALGALSGEGLKAPPLPSESPARFRALAHLPKEEKAKGASSKQLPKLHPAKKAEDKAAGMTTRRRFRSPPTIEPPFLAFHPSPKVDPKKEREAFGSVHAVGAYFITNNAVLFEAISILLLMAIVGVIVLLREPSSASAQEKEAASESGEGS